MREQKRIAKIEIIKLQVKLNKLMKELDSTSVNDPRLIDIMRKSNMLRHKILMRREIVEEKEPYIKDEFICY